MKLVSLILDYKGSKRTVDFGKKTLIHSLNNSSGKSTLLRMIFYSMGYSIPQTKGINFSKVKTTLFLDNADGIKEIQRENNHLFIRFKDGSSSNFFLPNDENLVFSQIWGVNNSNVLNNLLGAIYMDQEKGWTLLNRGTVIGNLKFKIEDFIEGLSDRDLTKQKIELESINLELKKYTQILNIIEYKSHLSEESSNSIFSSDYTVNLENKLNFLAIKKSELKSKINDLEESLNENSKFIEYVEKMNLIVKDNETGLEISVKKDNIINFSENQRYIETRLLMLKNDFSKVNKEIKELELEIKKSSNLFSLQSEIEKVDYLISKVNIPFEHLEKTISSLKKQKKLLNAEIKEKISANNTVLNNLHSNILKYADLLNVGQYINQKKDYIFTSDLKSLSGAVLHKIVFSFKMAYITELQNYLGYKVPIVLDSPSGRELDKVNIEETLQILKSDFSENQIIIASIHEFEMFESDEKLELINRIFEDEKTFNII
ncbi:hypothetical protein [Exiguobacterium sp. s181]|uniref:hypothetical protein n=1 Tax=Exiguobacterium sp. s181 TaxID=2751288 RepID=UPI001BE6686D|nr:hypothetical protein [Exiguobacterium sp. s181]